MTGPQGFTGMTGSRGATGFTGTTGATGPAGPNKWMMNIPDLLEQMTWAINEGGPSSGGKKEVFEFLSNVGRVIGATPAFTNPARPPTGPYAPDLLPLIQQMSWETGQNPLDDRVINFLYTIAWYFTGTGPKLFPPPFPKPTGPPPPPALQSLPLEDIPSMYQVAYWLLNEGSSANPKARAFLVAIGQYLFQNPPRTGSGPRRYPR